MIMVNTPTLVVLLASSARLAYEVILFLNLFLTEKACAGEFIYEVHIMNHSKKSEQYHDS